MLEIMNGDDNGLPGLDGAGTTTATKILEGFHKRSAGEARSLGTDPDHGGTAGRLRGPLARHGAATGDLAVRGTAPRNVRTAGPRAVESGQRATAPNELPGVTA